jgi:hypothetical protein
MEHNQELLELFVTGRTFENPDRLDETVLCLAVWFDDQGIVVAWVAELVKDLGFH